MSDTTITNRRVTQNPRTSTLAYAPISALPNGESATTKSSVPTSATASDPQYIKVGNNYYELKAKMPTAANLMFGEIAVGFPSGYERFYIKNSDTDIIEFAPNVDFKLFDESEGGIGNVITGLSLQQVGNHIRLGYDVGQVPAIGDVITSTDTTPTSFEHTITVGNAYIFQSPITEATFDVSSLVGEEDADTRETTIYFQVASSDVVVDLIETHTTSSDAKAAVHFGNYVSTTNGVQYQGFQPSLWYAISIKDNCIACGPQDESDIAIEQTGTGDFITNITSDGHTITMVKGGITVTPSITSANATIIGTITTPSGTTTLKSNAYALSQNGTDQSTIGLGINGATPSQFYTINNVAHATRADRMDLFSYTDVVYPTGLDIDSTISANAIHVDDEVENAIHKLDTKLAATLTSMVDFEELIVSVDEEIRESVGLEPDYSYANKPDPNVIVGATNIKEAIFMLDNAVGTESADTGVTAGSYGPSTDISGYSVIIPNFTVNSKGKLTQASNKTLTIPIDTALSTTSNNVVSNSVITSALNQKQDIGTVVYDTSSNNTATVNVEYNTSYIYTNATGFTTLTVNLANVTGTPTSTDFANITYEENIYFKATSNSTSVVLTNCNATYVFGQYDSTTHTFSGFTAGMWYCLSVKDNCVVCGPVDAPELSLASSTEAGSYLVTGLSVDGHTITYNHLDLSSTDTSKFLRHDGTWQSVSNVSVTRILTSGDDIATISVNGSSTTLKSNAYVLSSSAATNGTIFHFRKNGSSTDQNTITVYDKQVKQNASTENANLSILLRGTSTDANASEVKYANGLKYNPSTNILESGSFKKTNGTSSQFLMADGSVMQYRRWDIANTGTDLTVNSSTTQNTSQPSASASTYTFAPGETIFLENPITSLTVDLTNVTGNNASTFEAALHFIAGTGMTGVDITGNTAKFVYGNYQQSGTDYGAFVNVASGISYCLSVKDGSVICGPSAVDTSQTHVLIVDNTGSSLAVTMNGITVTPRDSNIDNIKSDKTNAYPSNMAPVVGDVVIIKENLTSTSGSVTKVLSTAYEYNGASISANAWPALSGNYSADDIILSDDIVLAGNYTNVGNIQLSSGSVAAKGMSLTQLLTQIFTLELKGSAATTPSVTFAAPTATSYEYGTIINSISYNKAVLNDGTYNYTNAQGSNAMGVTASAWAYNIIAAYGSSSSTSGSFTTSSSGTSPAAGTLTKGILISDGTSATTVSGTTYAVPTTSNVGTSDAIFAKTIQLSAVATATVGNWAPTNLHNVPTTGDLAYKYTLTTANRTGNSGVISGYRNIFYGNTSSDIAQTSAAVRGLSNNVKSTTSSITIAVVSGTSRRYIAMPLGRKITAAVDNGTGYSVLSNYEEITTSLSVNGANECLPATYRLYRCVAGTGSFNASHTITIGNA